MKHLAIAAFLLAGIRVNAAEPSASQSRYVPKSVNELRAEYMLIVELGKSGAISEGVVTAETKRLEMLAKDKFSLTLSDADLGLVVQRQKIKWFAQALRLLGIYLGFLVALPLLKSVLIDILRPLSRRLTELILRAIEFLKTAPMWIYESLGYLIAGWLLLLQPSEYLAVIGAISFPGLAFLTARTHSSDPTGKSWMNPIAAATFAVWAISTFVHSSNALGLMSVAALMYWLGFAVSVYPGVVAFGFREYEVRYYTQTCLVSLGLMILAWLIFYTQAFPPGLMLERHLSYFRYGIFSVGSMAYYVSLLALSGYWFRHKRFYLFANLAAIATGMLFLCVSFLCGIAFHFWACVFFLIFFSTEKYYNYILSRIGRVWSGAIAAAAFSAAGWWLSAHLTQVTEFLAPLLP